MAKIKECKCASPYQDKKYGKGKRVMNETKSTKADKTVYRCTVCEQES